MIYSEEDLPQGSEEWLNFRKNSIGGSEIGVLTKDMSNYWMSDYDIFTSKLGKNTIKSNEHMDRGIRLEPEARKFIKDYLNGKKENAKLTKDGANIKCDSKADPVQYTAVHKHNNRISASFDAVDINNKLIYEIKSPTLKTFKKMSRARKVYKIYRSQSQQELYVANSHWGIENLLFCYYHDEGCLYLDKETNKERLVKLIILPTVKLDLKFCENIENTINIFWENVENKKWNKDWRENIKNE